MFFVYVIKSSKFNWYYVGSTKSIKNRLQEHNQGQVQSTKFRLPYKLVYYEKFNNKEDALAREKEIKRNRQLKELIIKKYGPIV